MELETMEVTLEGGQKIKVVKAETVEAQLKQKDAELQKEREKEKNFKALRTKKLSELTAEQLAAIDEEKRMVMEKMEELDTRQSTFEQNAKKAWKESALQNLGLADNAETAEERKKVLATYDRLAIDPEDTETAIAQRMNAAFSLTFQRAPNVGERSIQQASHFGTGSQSRSNNKVDFSDTVEGKDLAKRFGMKFVNQEKK